MWQDRVDKFPLVLDIHILSSDVAVQYSGTSVLLVLGKFLT